MADWQAYLIRLIRECDERLQDYVGTEITPLDQRAELRRLDDRLRPGAPMLEREMEVPEERAHFERIELIKGLKEHALEHVLLTGRPGSGKTTALYRLTRELAQAAEAAPEAGPLPVLVKLRGMRAGHGHLELMREALLPEVQLTTEQIVEQVCAGRFFLILDGLNEATGERERRALEDFTGSYCRRQPLVVSTRDIQLGGNLGIQRQMAMLPMTAEQALQYARQRLGDAGEALLRGLRGSMRKLAETPLFLKMLCDFAGQHKQAVPDKPGLFFREYCGWHAESKLAEGDRPRFADYWDACLEELAFQMMEAEELNCTLQVPNKDAWAAAEVVLKAAGETGVLKEQKQLVKELCDFHLLRSMKGPTGGFVEFAHQLNQEYYAAERLLKLLTGAAGTPGLTDADLKWRYLNKLKWTEPLLMTLDLLSATKLSAPPRDALAERVLGAAHDLDRVLLARVMGRVSDRLYSHWLPLLKGEVAVQTDYPRLLSNIASIQAIATLKELIETADYEVRECAVEALGQIGGNEAGCALCGLLSDENTGLRSKLAYALGIVGGPETTSALHQLLRDEDENVRKSATYALGMGNARDRLDEICRQVKTDYEKRCAEAAGVVSKLGVSNVFNHFRKLLQADDVNQRLSAIHFLQLASVPEVLPILRQLVNDTDESIRSSAPSAIAKTGGPNVTTILSEFGRDKSPTVRCSTVTALGQLGGPAALSVLLEFRSDEDFRVRFLLAAVLPKFGGIQAIPILRELLRDEQPSVRTAAVVALKQVGSLDTINELLAMLQDEEEEVRLNVEAAIQAIQHREKLYSQEPVRMHPPQALALTLFIHGLGDSPVAWESLIAHCKADSALAVLPEPRCFDYSASTPLVDNLATKLVRMVTDPKSLLRELSPSIQTLANWLRTELDDGCTEYDSVVLVCHSLGGLIARQYIANELIAGRGDKLKVRKLVLYAVPNEGADIARLGAAISPGHKQLQQLERYSEFTNELNKHWMQQKAEARVSTLFVSGMQDAVVPEKSARLHWDDEHWKSVPGDHFSIIQATSPDDLNFKVLKNFILDDGAQAV